MGLFADFRERHRDLWEAMVTHPFVGALGDDTLPLEAFQRYFLQDYLFVRDLVALLGLAIARAPDFESARRLAAFLHDLLEGEESLFRDTFRSWNISSEEVRAVEPARVTRAFGDLLVRTAYEGGFFEALMALAVTEGTYLDWATRLVESGRVPRTPAYRAWVEIHADAGFATFVRWLHSRLDDVPTTDAAGRDALERIGVECLRHEIEFWDSALEAR